MNETTPLASAIPDAPGTETAAPSRVSDDLSQLTKARLSLLVLITTFVGYLMASGDKLDWMRLGATLFGTGLVAAAASVLNQVIEVNVDRLMERTKGRPLPGGRMTRTSALGLGVIMGAVGLLHLAYHVNLLAAYLAAATLLIYLAFYTPMKRRTSLCVTIGAVSGAIPPVIGWTAVDGTVGVGAWVLFGVLFAWQMPHFLAIAWMYRDEYAQAGFVMLRRSDSCGIQTAIQALLFSIALTGITLVPFFRGEASWVYFVGAVLIDSLLVVTSVQFLLNRNRAEARKMFFASIIYLPLILCLMVFMR